MKHNKNKDQIKIYMVDDHPMILFGVREQLRMSGFCELVGESGKSCEAEAQIKRLNPDLVIADLSLGEDSGIDLILTLRRDVPKLKILVYTMHDNLDYVVSLLNIGISGYILKTDPPEELLTAIKSSCDGIIHLSKKIIDTMQAQKKINTWSVYHDRLNTLSVTEFETLKFIAAGYHNRQIAELMHCSIRTVEGYRDSLMRKLDLHNVAELTILAVKENLIDVDRVLPHLE